MASKGKHAAKSSSLPAPGRLGKSMVETLNIGANTFSMFSKYLKHKIIVNCSEFLTSPRN